MKQKSIDFLSETNDSIVCFRLIFSKSVKALGCHLRMHGVKLSVIPLDVWDVHIHNNANSDT